MNKKVSILTPCYNMEKYIGTYLESILCQNYVPLELILVDDGSTDKTAEKIFEYLDKLERQGIALKYIKKKNGGSASALACGLPYVTGEYLTWPDSDDFLLEGSIQRRVEYLEENPSCGLVRSNGLIFKEEDMSKAVGRISKLSKKTGLSDFVQFKVPWCPGCYMVRMTAFDEMNPRRFIFDSPAGQDIQMLLPIVYKYPCDYLDEELFGYRVRSDSHSHAKKTYAESLRRLEEYEECVKETLKVINADTSVYLEEHKRFIRKSRYRLAWQYSEAEEKKRFGRELEEKREINFEVWVMKYFPYCHITCFLIRGYHFLLRKWGHTVGN